MAPDFGVLDAYFAVAAAAADRTLVPWVQPRRRGLMIVEDDILFERDFENSFQTILKQIDPQNSAAKPLMLQLYEGECCGSFRDLVKKVNESGVRRPAYAEPGWRWGSQAYSFKASKRSPFW